MFPKFADRSVRWLVGCRAGKVPPGTTAEGLLIPPLAIRFLGTEFGASLVSSLCNAMIFRSEWGGRYSLTLGPG